MAITVRLTKMNSGDSISEGSLDERLLPEWIEKQAETSQPELASNYLNEFLERAAQPRHASGNACIKLCYFVEQCKVSKSQGLREVAFSEKTCLDLFNFYLEWNEKNQHRSMRQILDLLTSLITSHPDKSIKQRLISTMVDRLLSIITHQASQPLVKPAFKTLEHFLGKGTLSIHDLSCFQERRMSINTGSLVTGVQVERSSTINSIVSETFEWMNLQDVSPSAGKFLVSLFKVSKEMTRNLETGPSHTRLWQRWIGEGLSKNPDALENVKNYLLPPLFKLDRIGSLAFLEDLNSRGPLGTEGKHREAEFLVHLSAIEVGKKVGLVEEMNATISQKSKKTSSCIILEESTISPLLTHQSDTVRSLAFSVLVSSLSSIRPFTPTALDCLQDHVSHLFADTDAKFRNDVLSNTKHMIERIRGATLYLAKEIDRMETPDSKYTADSTEIRDLLMKHESFVLWFTKFLFEELVPTASYQRHISSLRAISLLLHTGLQQKRSSDRSPHHTEHSTWPYTLEVFTPSSMRLLLDLLVDPFEDVRSGAATILKFSSSSLSLDALTKCIDRAKELSKRTGRADYADGVARSCEILYELQESTESRLDLLHTLVTDLEMKVSMAKKDLAQAVFLAPIHSDYAALNYIWDGLDPTNIVSDDISEDQQKSQAIWEALQIRIASSCTEIWNAVKDILCNDSPEGHVPEDIEDGESIDTKDVLSYSFRAIHESSNLMRTIASKIKAHWKNGNSFVPAEAFASIGNLTFDQLSNLRHRGAFSTVSLTFARCCQLSPCHMLQNPTSENMLERWYKGALQCIQEQASTTRRSAGIPALVTGVLSSNAPSPAFEDVMAELKSLARLSATLSETDETNLPQVHAMNCLKEIFKSSALGKRSDNYIPDCLQLAADSLTSEIWAIRNCGLLLLRSLIDCLFGTSESKTSIEAGWDGRSTKLSYEKYPALPELLLSLLNTETSNTAADISAPAIGAVESVFPALDIIRRAGPPTLLQDEIEKRVADHLGSKVWHIRELAARTMCTFMLHDGWLLAVHNLLKLSIKSTNHAHGVLMSVKFVLERRLALFPSPPSLQDIIQLIKGIESLDRVEASPETLAVFIEIKNLIRIIIVDPRNRGTDSQECLSEEHMKTTRLLAGYATRCSRLVESRYGKRQASGALLRRATACNGVYDTALTNDVDALTQLLKNNYHIDDNDAAVAALECVSHAWRNNRLLVLDGFIKDHFDILKDAPLSNSKINDQYQAFLGKLQTCDLDQCLQDFGETWYLAHPGDNGPRLSNADLKTSGILKLLHWMSSTEEQNITQDLLAWSKTLSEAGKAYNDFDTRFAAVQAFSYFFTCLPEDLEWGPEILPCLIALYDTLNDDDDEVRDLGAQTVSSIMNKSLIPLAASQELADVLRQRYPKSSLFSWNIICRMTGNEESIFLPESQLLSAEGQLSTAMKQDDSLFVEEEQNLFIDEVREAKLWSGILSQILHDESGVQERITMLSKWALSGLAKLNVLAKEPDGPLGWTSNPRTFACCSRILLSADVLLSHGKLKASVASPEQDDIRKALDEFIELGGENNIHQSLLSLFTRQQTSPLTRE